MVSPDVYSAGELRGSVDIRIRQLACGG